MMQFFSEENVEKHKEYLRDLRLKLSILKKSTSEIKSDNIDDIIRQKMDPSAKRDALELLGEIRSHELFFDSFGSTRFMKSPRIEREYGSEAAFLNALYKYSMGVKYGFVYVGLRRESICIFNETEYYRAFLRSQPLLALDMCEHTYFPDYSFDRSRYLISSLPYLAVDKIIT